MKCLSIAFIAFCTLMPFSTLQAQSLTLEDLLEIKNMASDDVIALLEKQKFSIVSVEGNDMFFFKKSEESAESQAIKLSLETVSGKDILKVASIEYALLNTRSFLLLRETLMVNDKIAELKKLSATLTPKNKKMESAIERSTYSAVLGLETLYFSFTRFIPENAIYSAAKIETAFKYAFTIQ